jgi:hypothetical protein
MPNDTSNNAGHTHDGEPRLLRNLIVFALPLLCLQRNILPIIKAGLQRDGDNCIEEIHKFVTLELLALAMVFDPPQKLRILFDESYQRELKIEIAAILRKLSDGLIGLMDAQEMILTIMIDVLVKLKNGKHP